MTTRAYLGRFGALAFVLILGCATAHPENPALDAFPPGVVGSTDVTYYEIHGRTAAELVAEVRQLGPKTSGASFFGETQSPIRWTWQSRRTGDNCQLTSIQVIVHSEIILPRWVPPADTVPGLVAQWHTFLASLETHEIGHKDISGREAKAILRRLQSISTFCSALNEEARRLTDGIVSAARIEQETYDAETRHGATQGAVFPPPRPRPGAVDVRATERGNASAVASRSGVSGTIPGCYELIDGPWTRDALLTRFYPVRLLPRSLRLDTLPLPGGANLQVRGQPAMAVRTASTSETVPSFVYWQRVSPNADSIMVGAPVSLTGAWLSLHLSTEGLAGTITTFTDAIPPDGITSASAPIRLARVTCP